MLGTVILAYYLNTFFSDKIKTSITTFLRLHTKKEKKASITKNKFLSILNLIQNSNLKI